MKSSILNVITVIYKQLTVGSEEQRNQMGGVLFWFGFIFSSCFSFWLVEVFHCPVPLKGRKGLVDVVEFLMWTSLQLVEEAV